MPVQCAFPPLHPLYVGYALMCRLHPLHVGYAIMCRLHPLHVGYIRYPLDNPPRVSYILGTGGVTIVYTHPVSVSMYHGTIPVLYRYRKLTDVDLS